MNKWQLKQVCNQSQYQTHTRGLMPPHHAHLGNEFFEIKYINLIECSECKNDFDSLLTLGSLTVSVSMVSHSFELVFDSPSHDRMSLVFRQKLHYFIYFGVFGTLRLSISRWDVLDVMTFMLWETIVNRL